MNLDPTEPDGARNLLLVKLLGGLVIAGIVIGLVVGVLGTTVLRSMGLKEQPPPPPSVSDSDVPEPTATDASDDEEDSESDDEEGESDGNGGVDGIPKRPTVLHARPNPAPPGAKITLSGTFRNLRGGALQVQRREGGTWTDFPVTASVNPNGSFSTYIITSRSGTSPYRLLHEQSGRSTPPVSITIG